VSVVLAFGRARIAYIANPSSADDARTSLEVTVTKQGAFTVTNGRTGFNERYPPTPRR
jgi:hypothetical protein